VFLAETVICPSPKRLQNHDFEPAEVKETKNGLGNTLQMHISTYATHNPPAKDGQKWLKTAIKRSFGPYIKNSLQNHDILGIKSHILGIHHVSTHNTNT
jgi:hypothetical protein